MIVGRIYPATFHKLAAKDTRREKALRAAKVIGLGTLGMGAGTLAGYGAGKLLEKAVGPGNIAPGALRIAGPVLGGGLGLAQALWMARAQKEIADGSAVGG
jgi:hypothetical protein